MANQLFESIGVDAATSQLVGTGPWELMETRIGEFWKFKAVADHYRKVPEFAEMTFYEILEESTRMANFQVGQIDVFSATPDQLAVMNELPDSKLMAQANSNQSHLGLYGSWYEHVGTSGQRPGYNPDLPWVSSNPDTRSPQWEPARKVRQAMGMAIDREAIVGELLGGQGAPLSMWGWAGHGDWELPEWQWEYDVERAKELLAEAGYPDGFELELTPVMRGVGAEVSGCEAVAAMWRDVGIIANVMISPYSTIRPDMISRTLNSITCHMASAWAEPVVLWDLIYDPEGAWSSGLDHPFLTNALDITRNTFDTTRRWQVQQEVGFWIWENVLDIGLYSQNNLYLLGPKLDSWAEHLERGNPRLISALEWAPHHR